MSHHDETHFAARKSDQELKQYAFGISEKSVSHLESNIGFEIISSQRNLYAKKIFARYPGDEIGAIPAVRGPPDAGRQLDQSERAGERSHRKNVQRRVILEREI
jgi:hypothetical protein